MPVTVRVDEAAVAAFLGDPGGPVGRVLSEAAVKVTAGAKRRCPVDTGRLRASIGWERGRGEGGLHADVGTDVPYALIMELGSKPHVIRSHGSYPLRDKAGRVFGPVVHHPGTRAYSYLRGSLDDLRGGG